MAEMKIAILLAFKDCFDPDGKFESRCLMLKHIQAESGGCGLPGIEITDEIYKVGIENSLKQVVEKELNNVGIIQMPTFLTEIEHEGKTILIYKTEYFGRTQNGLLVSDDCAMIGNWKDYNLTDLARKVIKKLPPEANQENHTCINGLKTGVY